jgi:hypothetical protein
MTLWTPNRKVLEPVPICRRCGGYQRRVADRLDFNRYVSLHWVCCCGAGPCQSSLNVALTSPSVYTSCFNYIEYDAPTGLVGTREISVDFDDPNGYCRYELWDSGDSASIDYDVYEGVPCTGTPTGRNSYGIRVFLALINFNTISNLKVWIQYGYAAILVYQFTDSVDPEPFNTAIDSQLTFPDRPIYGGTATVSIP